MRYLLTVLFPFSPKDNPYRIEYAVYNLQHAEIVSALVDAAKNGVVVQVLIEDAQLDPSSAVILFRIIDEYFVCSVLILVAFAQNGITTRTSV